MVPKIQDNDSDSETNSRKSGDTMFFAVSQGFSDLRADLREGNREVHDLRTSLTENMAVMASGMNDLRSSSMNLEKLMERFIGQEDTRIEIAKRDLSVREREVTLLEAREAEAKASRLAERQEEREAEKAALETNREWRHYLLSVAQTPPFNGILQGVGLLFSIYLASLLGFGEELVRYTLSALLNVPTVGQ